MGATAALSLGVAAGFVVLGISTRALETVTTFTHLSSLMVQAEPPISPNDKTLLAVLAGILTAGIGWVLVDWLVFGRIGMRTLIREREDDYEDEDDDAFRPTDPLDLVTPPSSGGGEWGAPAGSDTRRPLSARTDIGDPPKPSIVPGIQPAAMPGIDQLLPPLDQILPGAGGWAQPSMPQPNFAPPPIFPQPAFPQPNVAPSQFQTAPQPPADVWGTPLASPIEPSTPAPFAHGDVASPQPVAGGWLPTPGVRADGSLPSFDMSTSRRNEPDPSDDAERMLPPSLSFDSPPLTQALPPLQLSPAEPVFPTVAFEPTPEPPILAASWPVPTQPEPVVPIAESAPPVQSAPAPQPATPRSLSPGSGFDSVQLEDLLARLERGLEKRRASQARAAAQPSAPPVVHAPAPPVQAAPASPPRMDPLTSYSVAEPDARPTDTQWRPTDPPPFPMRQPAAPPPGFAAPQPVILTTAPVYDLPHISTGPAYHLNPVQPTQPPPLVQAAPAPQVGAGNDILDQPLHMTLELLRNKVKR